jgi:hypothetical protein
MMKSPSGESNWTFLTDHAGVFNAVLFSNNRISQIFS